MTFRSHNARLVHCAPYRVAASQRFVLTFKGSQDCVVDMDATAIAELKEALPEVCRCCHQLTPKTSSQANEIEPDGTWDPRTVFDGSGRLPIKPPCDRCKYWKPQRRFDNVVCCVNPIQMWGDFSCYKPKDGTE